MDGFLSASIMHTNPTRKRGWSVERPRLRVGLVFRQRRIHYRGVVSAARLALVGFVEPSLRTETRVLHVIVPPPARSV